MALPVPSIETIKKWIDYWRKFKGKRVRILLKSGFVSKTNSQVTDSDNSTIGSALEELCPDAIAGIIEDIVENPFGILLKNVSVPEGKDVESVFIPMSEILRIYFYKKSKTGFETLDHSQ
jgi:hypothetical protein